MNDFAKGTARLDQVVSRDEGPVSQKSRNFFSQFRVPQFPLYLREVEVLSHYPVGFSYIKNKLEYQLFETSGLQFDN